MDRQQAAWTVVTLLTVAAAVRAQRAAAGVGTAANPDAVGWYGAMELYRGLAGWAGKKALAAEHEYWKAVV